MRQLRLVKAKRLPDEKLVWTELTWGTETSKYPPEKKSNEILQVAASERSIAQTKVRALWGCRTCIKGRMIGEVSGKARYRG